MSCGKECENCGQVGGDGYAMSMTENIAGQPVVEAYNCCDNPSVPDATVADATNQVGGGVNPFNFIINPTTGARLSLFSSGGKALLKNMINIYKTGGAEETGQTTGDEGGDEGGDNKRKLTDAVEGVKSNTDESLRQLADEAIAAISEGINKESLAASKNFLKASKGKKVDAAKDAEDELDNLINRLVSELDEVEKIEYEKMVADAPEADAPAANKMLSAQSADDITTGDRYAGIFHLNIRKLGKEADGTRYEIQIKNIEDLKSQGKLVEDDIKNLGYDYDGIARFSDMEKVKESIKSLKDLKGMDGGATAEMADAFGEDYFNTEADALRGSWD